MAIVNFEAIESWPDWKRVLLAWRKRGHTGATVQSLAELTGRNQEEIWQEIRKDSHAYLQYCHQIQAPVVSVYAAPHRKETIKLHADYGYNYTVYGEVDGWTVSGKNTNGSKHKYLPNLVEALMKVYPHEEGYLGVEHCKGIRTLHRMEKHAKFLRAVAAGKAEPHESNKKGG